MRQLVNIIVLFLIVQFGGILIAIYTTPALLYYVQSGSMQVNSFEGALMYVIYIIAVTAVLLVIFRFYRKPKLFTLMEAMVVLLSTGFILFSILATAFPGANPTYIFLCAAAVTIALIIAKNLRPRLRNLLAITSSIGVGVIIGSNGFYLAYFLMLLISLYDYIAVFVTKHMVTMAKEMSTRNLAFLIGSTDVEAVPQRYLSKADVSEYRKQEPKSKDPLTKRLMRSGVFPVVSQVQLGSGDLALPLMLATSAYISFLSYSAAMMVIAGSAAGMIFTMYLLKRYKVALPAIPPLFAFCNLSLGIFFAINSTQSYSLWLGFFAVFIVTIAVLLNKLRNG